MGPGTPMASQPQQSIQPQQAPHQYHQQPPTMTAGPATAGTPVSAAPPAAMSQANLNQIVSGLISLSQGSADFSA